MGLNSKLPLGFRFDPTDEELLTYSQWKQTDPNDVGLAFIPDIKMKVHDPSEFPGLGAVMGKGGIMYIFAEWDKKYLKGKRLDRQVKMGSMMGHWKEVSGFEPIRSSDGDKQIGTKKKFGFKVGDSLIEWHMEEYRLCMDEHSKVSICRVSKKCGQARRTTKIDAKVDNVDHLCPQANNSKGKKEAGQSCISDMDSGREINGQKDGGPPPWCDLCSDWHAPKETGCYQNLLTTSPPLNVDNLHNPNWFLSLDDNFQNWPKAAEEYVDDLHSPAANFLNRLKAAKENVDNLYNPNWFLSPDDNFQNWPKAAEEYVDNPDTGNCQIADDTVPMDMDVARNCVSSPDHRTFFDTLEEFLQSEPLKGFEALEDLFQGRWIV